MSKYILFITLLVFYPTIGLAQNSEDNTYSVEYLIEIKPKREIANIEIRIKDASLLNELTFRLNTNMHSNVKANGRLETSANKATWVPPSKNAKFSLTAKIPHQRSSGGFDAYINSDWAIFRGDDIIPAAKIKSKPGARSISTLKFKLPRKWRFVNTGWQKRSEKEFIIDNPDRRFDRPTGWIIAGKAGSRSAKLGNTLVSVSAPKNINYHRMDILTLLHYVWPEIEKAFTTVPPKILIVGADDPMWRGGLSASNSMFVHRDRPLVSENGTSTLVHELVHVITRIRGQAKDDWIAEGIAEYYAIELLFRSGGTNSKRREKSYEKLQKWSRKIKNLRTLNSTGPTTARAAILFNQLNQEIKDKSRDKYSLDHLTKELMKIRKVSLKDLREECQQLIDSRCETLYQDILK